MATAVPAPRVAIRVRIPSGLLSLVPFMWPPSPDLCVRGSYQTPPGRTALRVFMTLPPWLLSICAGLCAVLSEGPAVIRSVSVPLTGNSAEAQGCVVDIAVLGPLAVDGGLVSLSPRDRVVLAALVVHQGEDVSAEHLADALWGDDPPVSWGKVVPGCVMRLRRVLGAGAIETTTNGYRLAVDAAEVDARRFERLVRRGHELLVVGEPDRAAHMFTEALAQWRGEGVAAPRGWGAGGGGGAAGRQRAPRPGGG